MSKKLVILFNHPHADNIEVLDSIYRSRYGEIDYILPMIESLHGNIFTSYRGSFSFHGMIMDYLLTKMSEVNLDPSGFFIFCQDDVLINPMLDLNFFEKNIMSEYGGFINPVSSFFEGDWQWNKRVYNRFCEGWDPTLGHGLGNVTSYLPDSDSIRNNFINNGINILKDTEVLDTYSKTFMDNYKFPLIKGLADFFIIKNRDIPNFMQFLKLFTAIDIFPEVAIPTALAGSVKNLYSNFLDQTYKTCILWGEDRQKAYYAPYVNQFFSKKNSIYLHPCKFSLLDNKMSYLKEIGYV